MQALNVEIPFRRAEFARANLKRFADELPAAVAHRVGLLLRSSADPDGALLNLVRLLDEQPAAFQRLTRSPAGLQYLIAVFSASRFLSEAIVRQPAWLDQLLQDGDMHRVIPPEGMKARLEAALGGAGAGIPEPLILRQFRRQQMLRILIRDLLGFGTLSEITGELSNLADALLDVSLRRIRAELEGRYGMPVTCDAEGARRPCEFSVIGLGKLGGSELNYSSDIDLMFVYSGPGETNGPEPISNREFFGKVANYLTDRLSSYTHEGRCYRVDLRLRPEGRLGELCMSVEGARQYYQVRARDWELQMLIKARVCAGERGPGQEILEFVQPLIFTSTLNFSAVESMSQTRQRIDEKVAARRKSGIDVKLVPGGIRDIEFLVQCLQRLHGGRDLWIQHPGTLLALRRLHDKELLSGSEYSRLAGAYTFLRQVEHRLQFLEDQQTHVLPESPEDLELLARRLPAEAGREVCAAAMMETLHRHLESTKEIYERVIHAQQPIYYSCRPDSPMTAGPEPQASRQDFLEPAVSSLVRMMDQRAPELALQLSRSRLQRGAKAFEQFLEQAAKQPKWLTWLDSDSALAGWVIDLFEESSHFGDLLVRKPDLIEELYRLRNELGAVTDYALAAQSLPDIHELRRFYTREMFRIQCESVCLAAPIFETLRRMSQLADTAIAASYRMAVEQALASSPPEDPRYEPRDQMLVVALGRLGMMEFDIASDADLVFILPDEDAREIAFWTGVAERLSRHIMTYTGEGVIFTVDNRLRPNGREGMLVQTEQSYRKYFDTKAEAWEGIAYMKSRTVAGNIDHGTKFLEELQVIDWRRYGQTARSRKMLYDMRMRLEKEQGPENPLKAGRGGYYDIDFCLMYLRLKAAGMFFKVLNTPERIDIIEKMGHLERSDAAFLRDAATFYRAVDHALRVYSGSSGGRLPRTKSKLDAVHHIVSRWTPDHLHDQPLDIELAQIQTRTREFFERLFQGPSAP